MGRRTRQGSGVGKDEWRRAKSELELRAAMDRQIGHLLRSAQSFDKGAIEEAERLATAIYILCHDGSQQKSLLHQMKIRTGVQYYDSSNASRDDYIVTAGPPLLWWTVDGERETYGAICRETFNGRWVKFSQWWSGNVFRTRSGRELSRGQLIFLMRSTDGGAHVDNHVRSEAYDTMASGGIHESVDRHGQLSVFTSAPDAHWHTVRQIAWELEHSLRQAGYLA